MKYLFLLTIFFLLGVASLNNCVSAQKTKKTKQKPAVKENVSKAVEKPIVSGDDAFKTLSQGDQSSVEEPFVFVARNAETYVQLQTKIENLPAASKIDFQNAAVVAAFAGTRPTPGYQIVFEQTQNNQKMRINLLGPPKDAMLAQVLTAPFRVILVPVDSESSLEIEPSPIWQEKAQVYRVTTGTFETSGGITGKSEQFSPIGSIKVWQTSDLITAIFSLNAAGSKKARPMTDTASGSIENNNVNLTRVNPGYFVEMPHPALKAVGILDEKKLTFSFESLPTTVADGFVGRGKIEAAKVVSSSNLIKAKSNKK